MPAAASFLMLRSRMCSVLRAVAKVCVGCSDASFLMPYNGVCPVLGHVAELAVRDSGAECTQARQAQLIMVVHSGLSGDCSHSSCMDSPSRAYPLSQIRPNQCMQSSRSEEVLGLYGILLGCPMPCDELGRLLMSVIGKASAADCA